MSPLDPVPPRPVPPLACQEAPRRVDSREGSSRLAARRAPLRSLLAIALFPLLPLLLSACPSSLDLRSSAVTSPNAQARTAWAEAEGARAQGQLELASQRLAELAQRFPADPLGRAAELELARLDRRNRRFDRARGRLEGLVARTPPGAELDRLGHERGLLAFAVGEHEQAVTLLGPLVDRLPPDEQLSTCTLLGESTRVLGRTPEAVRWFGRAHGGNGPVEQGYLRARLIELGRRLSPEQAGQLHGSASPALPPAAAAVVGARLAVLAWQRGDEAGARRYLGETSAARKLYPEALVPAGLLALAPVTAEGRPASAPTAVRLGLIAPLGGRARLVGERALRGAHLALRMAQEEGQKQAELVVVDEEDAGGVAAALTRLSRAGVVAVVGPFGARAAREAAEVASRRRGPTLLTASLTAGLAGLGKTAFRLVPQHRARASALVELLVKARARRALVLAPASGFGRTMATLVQAELAGRGIEVEGLVSYPPGQGSFVAEARAVAQRRFDALVIADSARNLGLWAPALARAGIWSPAAARQAGATAARTVTLVATGDGADAALLRESGRYLQGAALVPGFVGDADHPAHHAFLERYRREVGGEPGLVDAVAFESVRELLRSGSDAAALERRLRGGEAGSGGGLLGELRFRGGERDGRPLTVVIEGERFRVR